MSSPDSIPILIIPYLYQVRSHSIGMRQSVVFMQFPDRDLSKTRKLPRISSPMKVTKGLRRAYLSHQKLPRIDHT